MKIIRENLAAICPDQKIRQTIVEAFNAIPQKDSGGGMTLDMGSGPMLVALGKPSLADEKFIRQTFKATISSKCNLSRTNNVEQRLSDYNVASTPAEFKTLFGGDTATKTDKATTKPSKAVAKPHKASKAEVSVNAVPMIDPSIVDVANPPAVDATVVTALENSMADAALETSAQ
jgi:hypothetical protein